LREIKCSDGDRHNDNDLLRCDVILSGRYLLAFRRRLLLLVLPIFDYAISLWRENLEQNNFYLHFFLHTNCVKCWHSGVVAVTIPSANFNEIWCWTFTPHVCERICLLLISLKVRWKVLNLTCGYKSTTTMLLLLLLLLLVLLLLLIIIIIIIVITWSV